MTVGPAAPSQPRRWLLGVDSGGSGLRIALALADANGAPVPRGSLTTQEPVRTGEAGIDADHLLDQVLPAARALLTKAGAGPGERIDAVCVGAAGMATLGGQLRAKLPAALTDALGARRLALAADTVTGYAGTLGERPGAVVAAGTGVMGLGTDLRRWRRVDGWGHLLGDSGGGAWIGRAGLEAALRCRDGREGGSAALLASMVRFFGPAESLPGLLYARSDRAAVLASFAPEVAACAGAAPPDAVAAGILRQAARHIAATARAACPAEDSEVALTGGLLRLGEALLGPLREEFGRLLPGVGLRTGAGSPLQGALHLAGRLAAGSLALPVDGRLLNVPG